MRYWPWGTGPWFDGGMGSWPLPERTLRMRWTRAGLPLVCMGLLGGWLGAVPTTAHAQLGGLLSPVGTGQAEPRALTRLRQQYEALSRQPKAARATQTLTVAKRALARAHQLWQAEASAVQGTHAARASSPRTSSPTVRAATQAPRPPAAGYPDQLALAEAALAAAAHRIAAHQAEEARQAAVRALAQARATRARLEARMAATEATAKAATTEGSPAKATAADKPAAATTNAAAATTNAAAVTSKAAAATSNAAAATSKAAAATRKRKASP